MFQKRRTSLAIALVCLSLAVAACGNTENNSNKGANTPAESNKAANAGETADTDPYLGKYDPAVEISTVRVIGDLKFAEGEDLENNQWTRTLEERLGIKLKNNWIVKTDQGNEKMNVTIASGDLPDIFAVNATQLKQLVEAGELMDLTSLYDKHTSPLLKGFMDDATNAIASGTFDGKLMAFPSPGSTIDAAPVVWIRKDWLDKLSIPEPKSAADILAISEAFTKNDPDGNGKNDTYGLALMKNLYGAFGSLEGFFNSYHAYPQQWVKASDGTLVFGSVQPEMKTALAALHEMYKNGQIDKEFGVKDEAKEGELAVSGKLGMTYGPMWLSLSSLKDNRANDPNADWQAYPLASVDGKAANPQVPGLAVGSYYAVSKDAKNPEALFKMVNLFAELQFGPDTPTEDWEKHSKVDGIEVWPYFPFPVGPPNKNLGIHERIVSALEKKDPAGLNPEEMDAYKNSLAMAEGTGDANAWGYDKVFGPKGSFEVIAQYVHGDLMKPSEFYGINTPTMSERSETLKKMELEVFTKIIIDGSIDNFDKFVSDWKNLGGDAMTQEVNEWSKTK
ncbi:extracellular solute-binding protein [Paenibacillus sp. YIM B09110]|uniref:extracellular solute-binding protein n=1 Tax=Paenibacillus sp. YIM B09110 TaxID=3126102 RepID=UPI00301D5C5E